MLYAHCAHTVYLAILVKHYASQTINMSRAQLAPKFYYYEKFVLHVSKLNSKLIKPSEFFFVSLPLLIIYEYPGSMRFFFDGYRFDIQGKHKFLLFIRHMIIWNFIMFHAINLRIVFDKWLFQVNIYIYIYIYIHIYIYIIHNYLRWIAA